MIAKEKEAWKVYNKATVQVMKVYEEAIAQAREVRNKASAPIEEVRNKATAQVMKVYNEAIDQAWEVRNKAIAQARTENLTQAKVLKKEAKEAMVEQLKHSARQNAEHKQALARLQKSKQERRKKNPHYVGTL